MFFLAVLAMMVCASTEHIRAQQKTPLMEKIDAALEKIFKLTDDEKKYAEALQATNEAIEFLPQPVKENYKWYAFWCYKMKSYCLSMNKEYAPAVEAAKKALTFTTDNKDAAYAEEDLAHAYLMLGKTQEAEKIYRKYIGKTFGDEATPWKQFILDDFNRMREAGIESPDMAKIEQMFKQEYIKLRNANKNKDHGFAIPETGGILLARVSPNGELLLAITKEDQILLIDLLSSEVLVNKKNVFTSDDIQFSPDSKQVAMINSNNPNVEISYYDLSLDTVIRKQELKILSKKKDWYRFTFSSDGELIVLLQGGESFAPLYGDPSTQKCYFYDVQKETVLGENTLHFNAGCKRPPDFNATVVLSADNQFLFLPYCGMDPYHPSAMSSKSTFPPTHYNIYALEIIKTGKGKFIEATFIANRNGVMDISTSNHGFIYRDNYPEYGTNQGFPLISQTRYTYAQYKVKDKWQDQVQYYPWIKHGEFMRFLPGGQRGLFIFPTNSNAKSFNFLSVSNISRLVAEQSRITSKIDKAQISFEQKSNAELEAERKSLKPGNKTDKGLVLKREGDRVLVQPYDGKAADAKWYKISEVRKTIF